MKRSHRDGTHPTEAPVTNPVDQPVSPATAQKVLALLGLTEGEAQTILAAHGAPATEEEIESALKIDVAAIGHALDEPTVHALVTDPKLELPSFAGDFEAVAARLRTAASAGDKLTSVASEIHLSARLDADLAQRVLNVVVPQIRGRLRANTKVRETYSSILAYQAHRYPGARGARPAAAHPAPPPAAK